MYQLSYPEGEVRRIANDVHSYGNYGLGITTDDSTLVAETWESTAHLRILGADGDTSRAIQLTAGDSDGRRGVAWLPTGRIVYVARDNDELAKEDGTEAKPLIADSFFDKEIATMDNPNVLAEAYPPRHRQVRFILV